MLGEHIDSYEILEEIGKGGMVTVYRAGQASVERDVAVKAINAALSFWTDRLKVTPDVLQQAQEHAGSLDVHALVDKGLQEGQ